MSTLVAIAPESGEASIATSEASDAAALCLKRVVTQHFDFVWRTLRRLGIPEGDADDGAQQVFLITSRKLAQVEPDKIRGFLFGVARRVARDMRRKSGARAQTLPLAAHEVSDEGLLPDEAEDLRRQRLWLDATLDKLDETLRVVFVLSDIDEVPMREIAQMLSIPQGTVASRIRRARAAFHLEATRLRAILTRGGR